MSHRTQWCSRAFFVQRPTKEGEIIKSRQVSDLKKVNPRLVRVRNPLDGSSHILRRLEPDEVSFRAIDLSTGYDQVTIHADSRDLFTIILPTGKYWYTTLPQGASFSSDYLT